MKIVLCQPAVIRFKWELKVLLTNLKELHFPLNDVVLLFASEEDSYARYFRREFGVQAYTYKDRRTTRSYIPSIRPYLWWQYLSESKEREQETYLYVDSDVLFRELPVVPDDLSSNKWYCADTLGYTSYDYVQARPFGDEIVQAMNDIAQVTTNQLKAINAGMGGAQWFMKQPTADYWEKVYHDCIAFYQYFKSIPDKTNDNHELAGGLQIWTAEMYAQVWNLAYFGIQPVVTDELSFSWAVDNIDSWDKHNIYHNSGVTADMKDLFYKGAYLDKEPFTADLSHVNKDKASYKYVEAIRKVK